VHITVCPPTEKTARITLALAGRAGRVARQLADLAVAEQRDVEAYRRLRIAFLEHQERLHAGAHRSSLLRNQRARR
jgi:hypothetical protein